MTLSTVGALFVVGVLIHNAEEAFFLPAWSARAKKWHPVVAPRHFAFAVLALSALLLACAVGALVAGPGSVWAYLFSGYVFAMVANAVLPHFAATLATRSYMPGMATGLLLNAPLGAWFLTQAVESRFVQPRILLWVAPAVAVALALSIPVLFRLARAALPANPDIERRRAG